MAYGYNDGDQRPQSVRLAGRTTPTPRSTSDNGNQQRPQEQPGLLLGNKAVPRSSQTA